MTWQYRVHKCHCGKAAVTNDETGQPLCARCAQTARQLEDNNTEWEALAKTALMALYDQLGKVAYEAWIDTHVTDTDTWHTIAQMVVLCQKLAHPAGVTDA